MPLITRVLLILAGALVAAGCADLTAPLAPPPLETAGSQTVGSRTAVKIRPPITEPALFPSPEEAPLRDAEPKVEPTPAEIADPYLEAQLAAVDAARVEGDLDRALTILAGALPGESRLDPELFRSEIRLERSRVQLRRAESDAARADDREGARALLAEVVATGTDRQRSLAHNELGVLALRVDDAEAAEAALVHFRAMNLDAVPRSDRATLHHNRARAMETAGYAAAAVDEYRHALAARPNFRPAARRAFALLLEENPSSPEPAARLVIELLERGATDTVAAFRWDLMNHFSARGKFELMLGALLRYYAIAGVGAEEFRDRDLPQWRSLAERASYLRDFVGELELAYVGDLDDFVRRPDRALFRNFSGSWGLREDFFALTKVIGDDFAWRNQRRQALARYFVAWYIAETPEAGLYAAAIIQKHGSAFDQDGRVLASLLPRTSETTARDHDAVAWDSTLRRHLLLASVLESRKAWGPPQEPRSVIFQLEAAIDAEARIGLDTRSPAMRYRLANAYALTNRPARAAELYREAIRAFRDRAAIDEARIALRAARGLLDTLEAEDRRALEDFLRQPDIVAIEAGADAE